MTDPDRPDSTSKSASLPTSLVVNALADCVGVGSVLADEQSRTVLDDAYRAATDPDRREAFESALGDVRSTVATEGATTDAAAGTVNEVADDVRAELDGRDVGMTLIHETGVTLSERDLGLYRFVRTRDGDAFDGLARSSDVRPAVRSAGRSVARESYAEALAAAERAVDASASTDDAVVARTVAAASAHWAGEHDRALDHVEEALLADEGAWASKVVGAMASHDAPHRFEAGSLTVQAYFRARVVEPDGTDVDVAVGRGEGDEVDWTELEGTLDCLPVGDLAPRTAVRLRLSGTPATMPAVHAYYLAVGVVDDSGAIARTVDHVLLDGPVTADATESLALTT